MPNSLGWGASWGISTHWATYVFSTQLLDSLHQDSLFLTVLDPGDLENMGAARHPDEEIEELNM